MVVAVEVRLEWRKVCGRETEASAMSQGEGNESLKLDVGIDCVSGREVTSCLRCLEETTNEIWALDCPWEISESEEPR